MYKLGLLVDAESDFRVVANCHPNETFAHYNLALCLFQMGRYGEAEQALSPFTHTFVGAIRALNMKIEINKNPKTHPYTKDDLQALKRYDFELIRDMFVLLFGCILRSFAYKETFCVNGHLVEERQLNRNHSGHDFLYQTTCDRCGNGIPYEDMKYYYCQVENHNYHHACIK